ncbi:MAG TPA: tryptophan synthase subunit alpha [Candidatus Obscuribacterales bacterium]
MTDRYNARFSQLRKEGKKAFIPFTLLGWPDRSRSLEIIKLMIESGASALELGWAFSDPIADGPVIQRAAFETLAMGSKVSDALEMISEVRTIDSEIPVGLLVYYNMVLALGVDAFFSKAREVGVDGVLVADVPPECADEIIPAASAHGISPIFIVSPLTSEERLDAILRHASGFLYAVSRLGITGTDERYDEQLQAMIARVRAKTNLPLCVGFGISTPEQARSMLALGADGVITGSRIIEIVETAGSKSLLPALQPYLQSMVAAVRQS